MVPLDLTPLKDDVMAPRKRKTATELAIFSDVAPRDIDVETCSASQMPVPLRIVNNPAMKKMWDFIVTDMESRRCLSPTYTLIVSELVETWHVVHTCRENIDKNGYTFDRVDEEGNFLGTFTNPMVTILNRNQVIMLKLMEKIGMSPRDIVYLANPDAVSAPAVIQQTLTEFAGITYFR